MTTTNYLSPEDFKKMVDAIPLVTHYNKGKLHENEWHRLPNPLLLQYVLWVQYCHALRVSECLRLTKDNFNFKRNILTLYNTKTGKSQAQFTSIPPDFPKEIVEWIRTAKDNEILFPFTRQIIRDYGIKAANMVKLELGEQQKQRYVEGFWTHLIRKSRSKLMKSLGADREMRMLKLRHAIKDAHDAYDMPDINALIEWERENIAIS